ncbi:MAG TPA: ribosome biogenesis GTP-binding protein YihA/YsxC [Vicinamibacterales bacterium]|nr:ribosome biogenesis GTP-binding protein YihA/YsxC [Vicinamibacterales bacterium]
MKVEATFVTSAAGAADFPRDGRPSVALVGRSNVGKSSLINALVRRRLARTSAAPGKTRLANVYLVARAGRESLYLVDLPGYGYARGGGETARALDEVTRSFFRRGDAEGRIATATTALLTVDARHPGLDRDRTAWGWLQQTVAAAGIVATKTDKLSRVQRQRALRELEAVFEHPVLPVSAATGEGLDELWILIDTLASQRSSSRNPHSRKANQPPERNPARATAPRPPKR